MKLPSRPLVIAGLLGALLIVRSGFGQSEKETSAPKSSVPQAATANQADDSDKPGAQSALPAKKKIVNRLPNHYGKLGLSQEQREEIYSIQADYREKIAELEEQIRQWKLEESQEIQQILTENQRTQLRLILDEVEQRKAEKKKEKLEQSDDSSQ